MDVAVQATLLSSGLFMYFGPRDQVVPWFNGQLGYPYSAAMHGVPSDWIMDLVNVGFQKPTVSITDHTIQEDSKVSSIIAKEPKLTVAQFLALRLLLPIGNWHSGRTAFAYVIHILRAW